MAPAETASQAQSSSFGDWSVQRWLLLAVALFYAAMRVYHGASVCLDGDEIFSVGVASHNWHDLMVSIGRDSIHPPLFYFLLKFWVSLGGDSLFWVRLLPALFSTLAIIPAVLLGRELGLRPPVITTAVLLAALHPFMLYYSQHVRMYTLLMLCALTSLWAFHRALRLGGSAFVALTAANAITVYAHYYGWLVIGLQGAYVIFWRREHWKRIIASSAAVFVAFIPWIYWCGKFVVAKGGLASNLEWIEKPDAGALAWFFVDLAGFGDTPSIGRQAVAGLALLVVVAGIAAWLDRARLQEGHFVYVARFLLYFVLGSVAVAFIASRLLPNSVWGHRHMVYLVFPIMMVVAAAYFQLNSRAVRLAGAVLFAAWAVSVVHHHIQGDDKKTPFDQLVVQMLAQEAHNPATVEFYSVDKYLHYPVWFYLDTLRNRRVTGFAAPLGSPDIMAAEASRIHVNNHVGIADVRGAHFWIGYSSAWKEMLSPEAVMLLRGCRVGAGVTVHDRYHASRVFPVWCDTNVAAVTRPSPATPTPASQRPRPSNSAAR